MIDVLAATSVATVPVQVQGWTWTATMGALQNLILLLGGGGIGGLLIRAIVQLKRIGNERAKQEDDREGARWAELMGLNERLQVRVERLEGDLRDERKRCDDDLAAIRKQSVDDIADIRKQHVDEIRQLYERIEQMQRTFLQGQASTVSVLAANVAPKAKETAERLGQNLRQAMGEGTEE